MFDDSEYCMIMNSLITVTNLKGRGNTLPWAAGDYDYNTEGFRKVLMSWVAIQKKSVPFCGK